MEEITNNSILNPNIVSDKEKIFFALVPNNSVDDPVSSKALLEALENDNIRNIGITGGYGSGKTSFLESFKKNNTQYKYLTVSLASFYIGEKNTSKKNKEKSKDTNTSSEIGSESDKLSEKDIQNIEYSILQQIIYKESAETLPNSRFSRIKQTSQIKIDQTFSYILLLILAYFLYFKTSKFLNWFSLDKLYVTILSRLCKIFSALIAFIPFSEFTLNLLRKISGISLDSFEFKNFKLKINNHKADSLLNQNIDELLYFFECTDYNVVIFEDLDRFNTSEIFIHLREINSILNENKKLKSRKIRFIYAVKDGMFKNKERVKFFDFIIPIIPYITTKSSGAKLLSLINQEAPIFKDIDYDYAKRISPFIDDMRLLQNILNEYIIYANKCNTLSARHQELFSLIIYKNIDPSDFSKMQMGEGRINKFFSSKNCIIKEISAIINNEINQLENEKSIIQNCLLKTVKDIRALYLFETAKNNNSLNIQLQLVNNFLDDKNFESCSNHNYFKNFSSTIIDNLTYEQYIDQIKKQKDNTMSQIDVKLLQLRNDSYSLEKCTIQELLNNFSEKYEDIFKKHKIDKSSILFKLLAFGLITENYLEIISLFHTGFLTIEDNEYIQYVRSRIPTSYKKKLSNPSEVFSQIEEDFSSINQGLLNFSLLSYLLNDKSKFYLKISTIIDVTIKNEKYDFWIEYFDGTINTNIFSFFNNNQTISFFMSNHFSREFQLTLCANIIRYSELSQIEVLSHCDIFCEFITKESDIITLFNTTDDLDLIFRKINLLNITITNISPLIREEHYIYLLSYSIYEINYTNCLTICRILGLENNKTIYSNILNSNNEKLISYINNNLSIFISNVLLKQDTFIEDESVFVSLLNNDLVSSELKIELIKKYNSEISDISLIANYDLWEYILKENKIIPDIKSIYNYYKSKNCIITDDLTSFIMRNITSLQNNLNFEVEDYLISIFLKQLYEQSSFGIKYIDLFNNILNKQIDNFDYQKLGSEKTEYFISHNLIPGNFQELDNIRKNQKKFSVKFIILNVDNLLPVIDSHLSEFDRCEILSVYNSKDVKANSKLRWFEFFHEELCKSISSPSIITYIIKNNLSKLLSIQDLKNLFSIARKENTQDKKQAKEIHVIHIICDASKNFSTNQLVELLSSIHFEYQQFNTNNSFTCEYSYDLFKPLLDILVSRNYIKPPKPLSNGKYKIIKK